LDLGNQLNLLADGKLNLAVAGDVGIDWAMLEFQVTPAVAYVTNVVYPVADVYVRGGVNAGLNFGTNTTMLLKLDGTADNQRQSYLRWNLAGVPGNFVSARLRLTAVGVGTNGIENGMAFVTNNAWSESTITWSNQPGGGKRFATWIPSTNGAVEIVVTPQVQAALAGDGQLSLELFSLSNVGGPGTVSYASRESGNVSQQPQLLLVSVAPPQFTNVIRNVGGSFTLSGTGPNGSAYRILTATNLAQPLGNWTPATTGAFNGGTFQFTDLLATNFPQRFYRAVTP
jgi:hypothetical protein